MTKFQEVTLTDNIMAELIRLSRDWESEKSCYGYRANERKDILQLVKHIAGYDGVLCVILFSFLCFFFSI